MTPKDRDKNNDTPPLNADMLRLRQLIPFYVNTTLEDALCQELEAAAEAFPAIAAEIVQERMLQQKYRDAIETTKT